MWNSLLCIISPRNRKKIELTKKVFCFSRALFLIASKRKSLWTKIMTNKQVWVKKWCMEKNKNKKQENLAWPGEERFRSWHQNLETCAYINSMHPFYRVLVLKIACWNCLVSCDVGWLPSFWYFCTLLEAFKQTHVVRPKHIKIFWSSFSQLLPL